MEELLKPSVMLEVLQHVFYLLFLSSSCHLQDVDSTHLIDPPSPSTPRGRSRPSPAEVLMTRYMTLTDNFVEWTK